MPETILTTSGLSKKFGDRWAVKDLNLEVNTGDVFGFLGPNGAGKSTTIRMILTLLSPTAGSVRSSGRTSRGIGNLSSPEYAASSRNPISTYT